MIYWHIGQAINCEVLRDNRAKYGKAVIRQLAEQLQREHGNGFSYANPTRMTKFYSLFQEVEIVATASQQLSWSDFVELLKYGFDIGNSPEIYAITYCSIALKSLCSLIIPLKHSIIHRGSTKNA